MGPQFAPSAAPQSEHVLGMDDVWDQGDVNATTDGLERTVQNAGLIGMEKLLAKPSAMPSNHVLGMEGVWDLEYVDVSILTIA